MTDISLDHEVALLKGRMKELRRGRVAFSSGTIISADPANQTATVQLPDGTILTNVPALGNYIPEAGHSIQIINNGQSPSVYPPNEPITSAPPAQVDGVTVEPGIGSVTIRWNGLTEADMKWNRGYYQVQSDTVNTFNSVDLTSADAASTAATVSSLVGGTTYYFRVRALDYVGTFGAWSSTVSAIPIAVDAGIESVDVLPTLSLLEPVITGTVARWDYSNVASITNVSGGASAVAGVGGTSYTASQGTAGNRPATGSRNHNGLNVLDFDGGDYLSAPVINTSDNQTVFVFGKSDVATASAHSRLFSCHNSAAGADYSNVSSWALTATTAADGWWLYNNASGKAHNTCTITNPHYVTAIYRAGAACTLRVDGVEGVVETGTGAAGLDVNRMYLGAGLDGGGPAAFLDGFLGEVWVLDHPATTPEITAVETYYNNKWNLGVIYGGVSEDYPEGTIVFLTTDGKLYVSTGTTWEPVVSDVGLIGGGNVLKNSNFEHPTFGADWNMDATYGTWAADTTDYRYGTKSARLTVNTPAMGGNPDHYGRAQQTIQVKNYEGPWVLSAWMKGPVGRTMGVSAWRAYNIGGLPKYTWDVGFPGDGDIGLVLNVTATGEWQRVVMPISADPSTSVTMEWNIRAGIADPAWTAGQQCRIDGVQFEVGEVATAYASKVGEIFPLSITNTEIADLSGAKLLDNTVTGAKVVAGSITTEKLTVAGVSDSVLLNGGFEELQAADPTMAAQWVRAVGSTAQTSVDTAPSGGAWSGQNVLKLAPGATQHAMAWSATVPTAVGDTWYVIYYVKSIGLNAGTSPGFYVRPVGGALPATYTQYSNLLDENYVVPIAWTKREYQFVVPAGAQWIGMSFQHFTNNTGSTVMVDGVELRKVTPGVQIADGAINANKIVVGGIDAATVIANGTITTAKIVAAGINATAISAGSITTDRMTTGTIDASIISAATISSAQIKANEILADRVKANTLTANEINSNAITSDELSAMNIAVTKYLRSTTYTPGSTGWAINADGTAEFQNVIVRGTVESSYLKASTITGVMAASVVTNPGAATNTTGWTGTGCTLSRTTTAGEFRSGSAAFKLVSTVGQPGEMYMQTPTGTSGFAVKGGVQYSLTAFSKPAATSRAIEVELFIYDSGGSPITSYAALGNGGTNVWRSVQVTGPGGLPTNTAFASVRVTIQNPVVNEIHYIDDITLAPTSSIVTDIVTGPVGAPRVSIYSDNYPQAFWYNGIDGEAPAQIYRAQLLSNQTIDGLSFNIYSGNMPGGSSSWINLDSSTVSGSNRLVRVNADRAYLNDGAQEIIMGVHEECSTVIPSGTQSYNGGGAELHTAARVVLKKRHVQSHILIRMGISGLFCNTGAGTVAEIYAFDGVNEHPVARQLIANSAGLSYTLTGMRDILYGGAVGTYTFLYGWRSSNGEMLNVNSEGSYYMSAMEVSP